MPTCTKCFHTKEQYDFYTTSRGACKACILAEGKARRAAKRAFDALPIRYAVGAEPIRNSSSTKRYSGAELLPFDGRPGCNDALALPSRMGNRLHYRDGRVEQISS